MKYFKFEYRGESWPGKYALLENPEFVCGWDGEEGVYFDDINFIEFLDKAYEEYLKQKNDR